MLNLIVVTPERAFLQTKAKSVTLPGKMGEMQILPGHARALFELATGRVALVDDKGENIHFMIASGVVEIGVAEINVLCELASYKEEIDKEQEEKRREELFGQLKKSGASEQEEKELNAELDKAVARLSLFD